MRQTLTGVVISQGKMAKTVKVQIKKVKWNRIVSKYVTDHKNMLVHDELDKCREGDVVRIQYVRPLSARKSWAVAEIMSAAGTSWQTYQQEIPVEVRKDELAQLEAFTLKRQQLEACSEDPEVVELRKEMHENQTLPGKTVLLEVQKLEQEREQLRHEAQGTTELAMEARRLIAEEPERAAELIKSRGYDPELIKPSVQRNIVLRALQVAAGSTSHA